MKCKAKCKKLIPDESLLPTMAVPDRMIWTGSSLKQYRKCKRKFFWKYIARVTPCYSSGPLIIGKAFHAALAKWYRYKRMKMEAIAQEYQEDAEAQILYGEAYYDQEDFDKMMATVTCLVGMLQGYGEIYASERRGWKMLKQRIEARFSVNCGDFDFEGSVDCIPKIDGKDVVCEHKTAAKLGDTYLTRLPQDTQVRGYIFGAKFGLKIPVTRVLYDVVKKCKLRRKKDESARQFNERIMLDYMSRPDFYFMREELIFNNKDIAMFERDLFKTHEEFSWLINNSDGLDPDSWVCNDACCYEFFRNCDYLPLCLNGLTDDNLALFKVRDNLHEELAEDAD